MTALRNTIKAWAGIRDDRRGASAVEFALVVPVFLALVLSGFEMGWFMTQRVVLEQGLDRAARAVRIGDVPDIDHDAFKAMVCADAGSFLRACEDDLVVEMLPVAQPSDFPDTAATCRDRSMPFTPVVRFDPGARDEIIYVRACLPVSPLAPTTGFGASLHRDGNGDYQLITASAYLSEPE